ncbi:MAG TPA: hypothetical protein VLH08_20795 [Acidobacteriota bacterium]|nr:hypothetical protein [Acidobacteriota bacterium]
MKITNRLRGIEANESAENAKPIQPDKFQTSKGPTTTGLNLPLPSKDVFENLPALPGPDDADLFGFLRGLVNDAGNSSSQISSKVEKYKGPDSIQRSEIESRVDKYKGPDSLQRPEIESPVNKYKGPDSLPSEPKIESPVNKYKGPDSTNLNLFPLPEDAFDNLPSLPGPDDADLLGFLRGVVNGTNDSSDSKKSQIESKVNKYKGPDSIQLSSDSTSKESERSSRSSRRGDEKSSINDTLLRMQIENQLKKQS